MAIMSLRNNQYDLFDAIQSLSNNLQNKEFFKIAENELNDNMCSICQENKSQNEFFFLKKECCHKFCLDCLTVYMITAIETEGFECFQKKCPMEGCKVIFILYHSL